MFTISLIAIALFLGWLLLRALLRRRAEASRWHVVTRTLVDGSRRVLLTGPGGGERVVSEFPATLSGAALESAMLDARSKAFSEAMRLNAPAGARAPAPRTRS